MQTNRDKGSRLGRGLSALLPTAPAAGAPASAPAAASAGARAEGAVLQLAIEDVRPDKQQPRHRFEEAALEELAASIRATGILQPILVRRDGAAFRIVAGERRWRAAQRAGLKVIPALVKEATEKQAFELALVENLQREDLNPIEEAEGYRRLIDEHRLTQEACAERVGKDRSVVANALRLLKLPEEIKGALVEGSLSMGHARALLGLADDAAIRAAAADVLQKKLSVRDTEQLVRKKKAPAGARAEASNGPSPAVRALEEELQRLLGTKVRLQDRGGGKGKLEIEFFSHEELEGLLARLRSTRR